MKQTIDERVVEMRFDNRQFEAGAKQTMGTLERLKQVLKFPDYSNTFNDLQKSVNRVDMNGLGNAIESVKIKFSSLEVVAITALSNIVNKAVDAGVSLVKSLSTDQITSGFGEYELKMGSVQTIMASTKESLETVNGYLNELNEYSDKTIYSFSDMTNSIGKFTNAGVKLDDAVKAIQGVSNEAAISGANANEASRAMYNFAQALSAGSVKLIDWKSIENANMATVEFKQSLLDTAVALGTVVKEGDNYQTTTTDLQGKVSDLFNSTTMFNESLSHQWLTTDVLVQTLGNYSTDVRTMTAAEKKAYEEKLRGIGYTEEQIKKIEELGVRAFDSAQNVQTFSQLIDTTKEAVGSGWSETFELIVGDYEEAGKLWTNVNKTLGKIVQESADSRNELLRGWKETGGRDALFEGISNSFNSLLSIVKAVKDAFQDVFPKTTGEQLAEITKGFRDLTSKLAPSSKALGNLRKTFKGLFSIVDIVRQAIGAFFKLIVPGTSNIKDLGSGILDITANIGDWITNLNKAIKENGFFTKSVEKIREIFRKTIDDISDFIVKEKEMFKSLFGIEDKKIDGVLNNISNAFKNLSLEMNGLNFKTTEQSFDSLKKKIQELLNLPMSNEGFSAFVNNFKQFGEDLREAFTLDNLLDRIEKFMSVFEEFFNWVRTTMAPAFKDLNVGGVAATAGGLGIIYAMIKASKAFEKVANTIKSIPDLLGGVKDTLVAYQKQLEAEAIFKISLAIAALAGALVLLSFADSDRLMTASIALTIVAAVLLGGITKLLQAANKGKELNSALTIFSKGLNSAMKKLGRAMEIRAIGSSVKKFAEAIAIIAVTIIALGYMYKKDKDSLLAGLEMIKLIGLSMTGIMLLMSILSKFLKSEGAKNISKISSSMLMVSASLGICVYALSKVFEMEIPSDWEFKVKMLAAMLGGLGILVVALGFASRIAGKKSISGGPILSMAALLAVTVIALDKLFKMEFPPNWQDKVVLLGLIFGAFAGLMLTIGFASRLAKKSIKAAGTILAMCVFIATVVAALMILSIIPTEDLLAGAISLGIVLTTLGVALFGAGKVSKKSTYKSVLAMAIAVGAITAALGVLAMVPFPKLLKACVALGSMLIVLAVDLKQASKITSPESWTAIMAMVIAVGAITLSLYALANQPWNSLLSAAISLGGVLLAFGETLKMISNIRNLNIGKIGLFLLATTSLIPIGVALYALATQPWDRMLAAGLALSGVLLAFSASFKIISLAKPNPIAIAAFLAGAVGVGLIAFAIYELAKNPIDNLLEAAVSLSLVLVSFSAAMKLCSSVGIFAGAALTGIGLLDLFIADLALVLVALGAIFEIEGAKKLLSGGAEILVQLGQAIGDFVGAIVNGVITGVASSLPAIGEGLSGFMDKLGGFIEGSKTIDDDVLKGVGILAACIIAITVSEVIAGIGALLGGAVGMISVAANLVLFIETLQPFLTAVENIKPESIVAVKNLAEMIIMLTAADFLNGINKILGFGGDLSEFGDELVKFGPRIAIFANQVKNVNPDSVKGAAAAAEIMANLSKKLPGIGGFVNKIFGTRSLAEFGDELNKFGPRIVLFSTQVKNVNPDSVKGAAAAAEIMANLATKLPAQKGLANKIFGTRNLAEFGDELVKFGPRITLFAIQVKDIAPQSVKGVESVTNIMARLANNLPETETLWNKIFGGGQATLSSFGDEIVEFGTSMKTFSETVAGISTDQVNGVITNFKNLINLAMYVEGKSATDLINFSNQLSSIDANAITAFVQTFANVGTDVVNSIDSLFKSISNALELGGSTIQNNALSVGNKLCDSIKSGIIQKQPELISAEKQLFTLMTDALQNGIPTTRLSGIGQNIVQGLITGINVNKPLLLSIAADLCMSLINRFKISLSINTFNAFGQNIITWIVQGMFNKRPIIISSVSQICNSIVQAFKNNLTQSKFIEIGANAALGLKYGIESKINEIAEAAVMAASTAVEYARMALDENSPSKVAWEIGEFFSIGMAGGITNRIKEISLASKKATDEAVKPIKGTVDAITSIINSGEFDIDPVIRPLVDLSDVEKGARDISTLMNRTYDLSSVYNRAMDTSSSFNRNNGSNSNPNTKNSKSAQGDIYEFNQYNYSPKALSRSEIYRQTNNQFSAFRKAVNPQ